jgi:hypothetical protein
MATSFYTMTNPYKLISTKKIFENPWMQLDEDHVEKDGRSGVFGVTTIKDGVCILVLDDDDNVLLVNEFKYALAREDLNLP